MLHHLQVGAWRVTGGARKEGALEVDHLTLACTLLPIHSDSVARTSCPMTMQPTLAGSRGA